MSAGALIDRIDHAVMQAWTVTKTICPLDAFVRTIERETLTAMGETRLPPVLAPVDFVLR